MLAEELDEWLCSIPIDLALISDVVCHLGQQLLVQVDEVVERSLTNVEGTESGKEVVSYEETEEYEVVNNALNVKFHFHFVSQRLVLQEEVLAEHRNLDELEGSAPGDVNALHAALLDLLDYVLLADDLKVGLVREQGQHDQVCVGTIKSMARIRVIIWRQLEVSNIIHHFVLSFSRHTGV
jgi:hypothetical protein